MVTEAASAEPVRERRGYDAASRRERAGRQRRDTLERVLTAARDRFLADGYAGTRVVDIAAGAGVSLATVYKAGRSKGELIRRVIERAMAGDASGDPLEDLPRPDADAAPGDRQPTVRPEAEAQVGALAERIADTLQRAGDLWTVLRDAAGVDETAAAALEMSLQQRLAPIRVAIRALPADRLRGDLDSASDAAWALTSPEVYQALCSARGWSHDRYRAWLIETLVTQLLLPAPPVRNGHGRPPDDPRRRPGGRPVGWPSDAGGSDT